MKKNDYFFRAALVVALVCINVFGLRAGTGDFNAWNFTTGHDGASCGRVISSTNDLTVEMWLNLDQMYASLTGIVGTMGSANSGFLIELRTGSAATNNEDNLRFLAKPLNNANNIDLRVPVSRFIGQWTHVAYVISSVDNKAYLYVNGEPFNAGYSIANFDVATGGYYGSNSTSAVMSFAKWYTNPKPNGNIADFRIWEVARTATQIKENYNKNLVGTNSGLIVNYDFATFERGMLNIANPTVATNTMWLNPGTGYQLYHTRSVLVNKPDLPTIADNSLTWTTPGSLTSNTWVVEIAEKSSGNTVRTSAVDVNTFSLSGLPNGDYTARVRTKNTSFYSGLSEAAEFTVLSTGNIKTTIKNSLIIQTVKNGMTLSSDIPQLINIHGIDGRLIRSVKISEGNTTITDLKPGIYLVNNKRIIIL